jgi:hypothetical protein
MIKIDVAPVFAIAILVAIVIAFRYWGAGLPHKCQAIAASDGHVCQIQASCGTFDVTTVNSSLARRLDDILLRMGSKDVAEADTK